jgi:hypothetical protein
MTTNIRLASDEHAPAPHDTKRAAAPSYGGPQRDAINSVVDGIVGDICKDVQDVHRMLDDVEQQVLESAAAAKARLQEHVGVCVSVKDEIQHMRRVIDDIKNRAEG